MLFSSASYDNNSNCADSGNCKSDDDEDHVITGLAVCGLLGILGGRSATLSLISLVGEYDLVALSLKNDSLFSFVNGVTLDLDSLFGYLGSHGLTGNNLSVSKLLAVLINILNGISNVGVSGIYIDDIVTVFAELILVLYGSLNYGVSGILGDIGLEYFALVKAVVIKLSDNNIVCIGIIVLNYADNACADSQSGSYCILKNFLASLADYLQTAVCFIGGLNIDLNEFLVTESIGIGFVKKRAAS